MADYFSFDGVRSSTYLARVFPTETMTQAPARIYDTISVPGRSGQLLIDRKAYDNVIIEYDVVISGDQDFTQLTALRNFLASRSGYKRLQDSFDTEHYRMAAYMEPFNMLADWASKKRGRGTISFNCKPQRYLHSGLTPVVLTASGTLTNPTQFDAKPLLYVTTTASGAVLGVGGVDITINRTGVTNIDCETGRCYLSTTSLDDKVVLSSIDFPTLAPGSNGISLGSGISRVEIRPRWWEL